MLEKVFKNNFKNKYKNIWWNEIHGCIFAPPNGEMVNSVDELG
jgi:hypothetical protein